MGNLYVKSSTLRSLKCNALMFLSQLTSLNGQFLLKWTDITSLVNTTIIHRKPKYFSELELVTLQNPTLSRRLFSRHFTSPKELPNPLHIPNMTQTRTQEWMVVYSQVSHTVIIGKVRNKSTYTNSVIVEHWLHWVDNEKVSPSYLQTIVQPCPSCNLHIAAYGRLNATRPTLCTASYLSSLPVTFTQG